ncbi:MAG: twin-arginine translocation signal domain-containing protein, partial [Desulfotignum balticum]|nr:twin-arginine translocation signal domain-containing protein [Desulfotignum balticum]
MDRRDFLKKTITTGIAAGSTLVFPKMGRLWAASQTQGAPAWDLV